MKSKWKKILHNLNKRFDESGYWFKLWGKFWDNYFPGDKRNIDDINLAIIKFNSDYKDFCEIIHEIKDSDKDRKVHHITLVLK